MRTKNADTELYTDYLLSTFGDATATGLSAMVEGDVSLDRETSGTDPYFHLRAGK